MKTISFALRFSVAMTIAVMAHADGAPKITAVTPIFGQVIALRYPSQFKMVNEQTQGTSYIQESVKAGETVDQWSEMITLTGRKGAASAPQASAKGFVLGILKNFQMACPDTFSTVEVGPRNLDGQQAFAIIGSCGNVSTPEEAAKHAAHSETALILGIKGSADIYTVQWAQRGQPSNRPITLDAGAWTERFRQLEPIHLCEHGPNEVQSCAAKK